MGNSFNADIGGWDISTITNIDYMFSGATNFNQDISAWDVSGVSQMIGLVQDISNWDVSHSPTMNYFFQRAVAFNQNLSKWDVSRVSTLFRMFTGDTHFNHKFCWKIKSGIDTRNMYDQTPVRADAC